MKIFHLLVALLFSVGPVQAQTLPDPIRFSIVIERGDVSQAAEWLDAGLSPDFEGAAIGSGVMIAAWEGNIPMMELFVVRGADINRTNSFGEQALLHAAWKGHLPAVRWLVERGARLNRQGREWAALHYAAFAGHAEVVGYLLERGADINALSTNGSTPLMMAAREGREAIAKTLLAAGARRDIVNERGDDAMRWAMRYNNLRIAQEIAGAEGFAAAAQRPAASWGRPLRSQAVPDRADLLLAQARKMEAAGRRDDALKLYRGALAAIRRADAGAGRVAVPVRAATGMTITARRGKPDAQSAALSYATPAAEVEAPKVGADETTALQGGRAKDALRAVADGDTAESARGDAADDWLRRARALEAAGRRKDALHAYRQAAGVLRGTSPAPRYSPVHP
jgi:tetratricopeptide (TPR) repeat protein